MSKIQVGIGFQGPIDRLFYHARPADANIDDSICFTDTQVGPGHKRDILGYIGKNTKLGTGKAVFFGGQFGRLLDGAAHHQHRVHIDACPGGCHIDRGANPLGGSQSVGDGFDKGAIAARDAFLNQGRKAANEVNIDFCRGRIEGFGDIHHL